ncbi:MAG: cytochrome c maturation protein CcmE [Deltaproteobacteria bacterium]|nr:cytochrome c maturation protein CcmE [Deltaproteobacteria bacterium]
MRAALAVAALVVVTATVYLVVDAFSVGSVTFRFVDEVLAAPAELQGRWIKVSGTFVAGSRAPAGPDTTRFVLEGNGARLTVLAPDDSLPGGFDVPGRDIVADGRLEADGNFHAGIVTTGCPSRYEGRKR